MTEIWNFLGIHIHQEFKILTSENNGSGLFLFKEKNPKTTYVISLGEVYFIEDDRNIFERLYYVVIPFSLNDTVQSGYLQ